MPTANQKRIKDLEEQIKGLTKDLEVERIISAKKLDVLQEELETMRSHAFEVVATKNAIEDAFNGLREAVDEAGFDVFIDGEHKPWTLEHEGEQE